MKVGTVIILPVNNEDTSCIVINKKTYGELRRNRKVKKFVDTAYEDSTYDHPGVYIFTFTKLYGLGRANDESLCYELLMGDEKAWIRQHLLNKYVRRYTYEPG